MSTYKQLEERTIKLVIANMDEFKDRLTQVCLDPSHAPLAIAQDPNATLLGISLALFRAAAFRSVEKCHTVCRTILETDVLSLRWAEDPILTGALRSICENTLRQSQEMFEADQKTHQLDPSLISDDVPWSIEGPMAFGFALPEA